ncbi:MAG: DUF3224 domain-containing protein [Myxococcales bacterium]|nr:DUF3224 domain-containing protein [Myxococcales bacterium]
MTTIRGTFDVTMHAEPPHFERDGVAIARATFDKTFHGPLSAESHVDFLSVRAGEHAAYVAIERIEGTVDGKAGSFVVTHKAQASSDGAALAIEVVPGTGTGELAGLTGTIDVEITDGVHHYAMTYALP